MSLNVNSGILKVDGDTSGAVKALDEMKTKSEDLGKSSTTLGGTIGQFAAKLAPLAGGLAFVGTAMAVAKTSWTQFNDASKASADLFDQFGEESWLAATKVTALTDAVDNLINVQTMASAYNKLVRSDIGATEEQLASVGKAAVELGEKTGRSANEVMAELTDAIAGGATAALRKYGIIFKESEVLAKAQKDSLEETGEGMDRVEKKNAKTKLMLDQLNEKYKSVIITAQDINDIEEKYHNVKNRNMAIVAKTMENTAKAIQSVKHGFEDAKQEVIGFLNGMDKLDDRALSAMRQGVAKMTDQAMAQVREQMAKVTGESEPDFETVKRFYSDRDKYDKSRIAKLKEIKTLTVDETKAMIGRLKDSDKEVQNAESLVKGAKLALNLAKQSKAETGTSNKVLADLAQETVINARQRLELVEKELANKKELQKVQTDIISKSDVEKFLSVSEATVVKLSDVKESANAAFEEQRKSAEKLLKEAEKKTVLDDKTVESARIQKQQMIDAYQARRTNRIELEKELVDVDAILETGKQLTVEQQARYNNQKSMVEQLKKEEEGYLGILQAIMKLALGIKPAKPGETSTGGQAAAWQKEYDTVLSVIKKGNADAVAEIENKFGSLDRNKIKAKLKENYDEILKAEKDFVKEYADILKQKSDDQVKQIDDDDYVVVEGEKRRFRERLDAQNEFYNEKDVLAKAEAADRARIAKLRGDSDTKVAEDEIARNNADIESKKKQISNLKNLLTDEIMSREEYKDERERIANRIKEIEKGVTEAEEKNKDKRVEIKLKEQEDVKKIYETMKNDIKGYGESLVKGGAGALFDAMTIEKAALKESAMSRSEMLRKALKEELQSISKQAFVQSLYQAAMGLARYAVGDAAGGSAHMTAAAAYAAVSGVALASSAAITAPSDAEIARRKAKDESKSDITNSSASVSGTSAGGGKVINIYWPQGLFIGDKDQITKVIKIAEEEADRRGK